MRASEIVNEGFAAARAEASPVESHAEVGFDDAAALDYLKAARARSGAAAAKGHIVSSPYLVFPTQAHVELVCSPSGNVRVKGRCCRDVRRQKVVPNESAVRHRERGLRFTSRCVCRCHGKSLGLGLRGPSANEREMLEPGKPRVIRLRTLG